MKQPNVNKLIHKMQLKRALDPDGEDARGDEKPVFEDFARVWVSIEPLTGRELQFAQQMHGNVSHKISMRYIAGVNKRTYGVWNGRTFQFGPPLSTEETQSEYTFYATERV